MTHEKFFTITAHFGLEIYFQPALDTICNLEWYVYEYTFYRHNVSP